MRKTKREQGDLRICILDNWCLCRVLAATEIADFTRAFFMAQKYHTTCRYYRAFIHFLGSKRMGPLGAFGDYMIPELMFDDR